MTDIVKCTVYVTDRAHWQPMNDVYFSNFKEDPPHRVSCIVSGLGAPECLVEIDATAYLGKTDDKLGRASCAGSWRVLSVAGIGICCADVLRSCRLGAVPREVICHRPVRTCRRARS